MATRNTDDRLEKFLKKNGMTCEEAMMKGREVLNLKDKVKLQVAGFLLDRWCMATSLDGKEYFVKHVKSEKTNVLYQIILGGEDWDGVYTLVFKRCPVCVDFENDDLVIKSFGNYDAALFKDTDTELQPILIAETMVDSKEFLGLNPEMRAAMMEDAREEKFIDGLFGKSFVDNEELEIFRKPDAVIKPYLRKVLPRVKFVC